MKKKILLIFFGFLLFCLIGCESTTFTITFTYEDGTEITKVEVKGGSTITEFPEVVIPEGYVFNGWDKDLTNIKSDLTVIPKFSKKECQVKFVDEENNEILNVKVEYGSSVTPPQAPEKDKYVFVKWDKDLSKITEDCIIKPIYEYNYVTIKFMVDDKIYEELEVKKGEAISLSQNPEKEGYDFVSWDKELENITEDVVVNAIFKKKVFKVTYLYENGEEICTKEFEYNEMLTFPTPPVVKGYTFDKWNLEEINVVSGLQVKALYKVNEYTITYYNGKEEVKLEPSVYTINDLVYLQEIEKTGYIFAGWFESETSTKRLVNFNYQETGNKTLYARFESDTRTDITVPKGTFTITEIAKFPHSQNPNLMIYQPVLPSNAPTSSKTLYNYEIADTTIATISIYSTITPLSPGITVLKATYQKDPTQVGYALIQVSSDGVKAVTVEEVSKINSYKVRFRDSNSNIFLTQTVKEGFDAVLPLPPIVENKGFSGWEGDYYNIKKDSYVRATYSLKHNRFVGKTVSILGDSMSTYKGIIPEGFACFYPYATCDVNNPNQTWWMQIINKLGMQLLMNNSYSGSCVSDGTGNKPAVTKDRLSYLIPANDKEEKPDIIIIFMGANDCGSRYVSLSTFTRDYEIMMKNIKELCPDSEIFLMTLPDANFFSSQDRIDYNKVIENNATKFSCHLLSLDNVYTRQTSSQYLCDSIHPNFKGMTSIANVLYNQMKLLA
ncbi:MAG: InlB B-repeat-containing protein [Coprobacillus sp.]|nr:InlB B-repeat-containing protein [Coprobacillus sp.]MDY4145820.1 InlB B-repeat-containing protein [Bacilli bacterium]